MDIEVAHHGSFTVITLAGEVDLFYADKLRKAILAELAQQHPVVVELSQVSYIDSSGVASLVDGLQVASENHLKYALLSTSTAVMQVLELARFERLIPMVNSIEEFSE